MKEHVPASSPYNRCDDCRRTLERNKSRRRRRTGSERQRRQDLVAEHVRRFGWNCPGWQREPHAATDLTADHVTPQAAGAAPESTIRVLCRSCNGRRGAGQGAGLSSKTAKNRHPPPAFREKNQGRERRGGSSFGLAVDDRD